MNKVWIIIKREYLTRVKKKTFLLATFLLPLVFLVIPFLVGYLMSKVNSKDTVVVYDQSNYFKNKMDTTSSMKLLFSEPFPSESDDSFLTRMNADVLVKIYPFNNQVLDSVVLFSENGVGIDTRSFIEDEITDIYTTKQMEDAGIDKLRIDSINNTEIQIKSYSIKDKKETHSEFAMISGIAIGLLMFFLILLYGASVMRGVMEEKTNRIAEVIISSVHPFQLMLGKIIGIGFVCLTQFTLWLVLMGGLRLLLPLFFPDLNMGLGPTSAIADPAIQQKAMEVVSNPKSDLMNFIQDLPWAQLIICFFIYFIGGYFLYASMYAAVGSLVNEDPQEAQQLSLPITLPILLSYIMLTPALKDPHGSLAVFASMFPFSSPIIMMARIPYGVPFHQIVISVLLLIGGFLLITWISAKIYRTGILLYGKKVTWKEIIKWVRLS